MAGAIIAVLGPLAVNSGDVVGRRDRVVLAALALHSGQAVSAERLADALWADQPPASWNKVIAGCVVRLRKTLGATAIETTPHGYRLAVAAEAVDAQRFERLVGRGRELLVLGEPERAAFVLSEALGLWRGRPLVDLGEWEPGRIEGGRLEELRLDAEEVRIDACLQSGQPREVLAEAQARVAEAPLRERRWALLALAQYQVGRQGDALRSLHTARSVLARELGLAPGPELVALEQAILCQDPTLVGARVGVPPSATCPYLGLVPYDVADADAFFGREAEVAACLQRLAESGVLAVIGPSGSGKSSLVRAGVAAALRRDGRRVEIVTPGARPGDVLAALPMGGDVVVVVDQCEEAMSLCDSGVEQVDFFTALVERAAQGPMVVAVRADRLGEVSAHAPFARLLERGLLLLGAMDEHALRAAVENPAHQAGLLLEPGLVDLLVRDVEGEPGALPLLSHALRQTWQRREGRTLTVAGYRGTGGIRGAVARSAEEVYERVPADQRPLLRDLLLRLVAPSPDGEPIRGRVPRRTLAPDADHERLIEQLVAARLVTSDDEVVQLAHEALARAWPRLRGWLEDDVDGQRILRHVTASAEAWDAMGRPDSELYRGIRLTQALDWRTRSGVDVTPTERDFLDGARRQAEQEARRDRHRTRRRSAIAAGVSVLAVVALVAGVLAVRQGRRADTAGTIADARRLSALSLDADGTVPALLFAAAAVQLDESPDTRASLFAALTRSPALIDSLPAEWPPSLAVSPTGDTIVVGDGIYDPATLDRRGGLAVVPAGAQYRPDGAQLAVAINTVVDFGVREFSDPPLRLIDTATSAEEPVQLGGLPDGEYETFDLDYSADGRFLAASFDAYVGEDFESMAMVWELTEPTRPVQRIAAGQLWGLALGPDGRHLYIGDHDPELTVYDVATGRPLRSVRLGDDLVLGTAAADDPRDGLEVSPDGAVVAHVDGDDIVLRDGSTLEELRRLRDHTDVVRSIHFSADGTLLASGSEDGTAAVWDVATGRRREVIQGHERGVERVAFHPDAGTLYTLSEDELLVWDRRGDRRFIASADVFATGGLGSYTLAAPDGGAVVRLDEARLSRSASTDHTVTFLDTRSGRVGATVGADGGSWSPAWQPPDGERLALAGRSGTLAVWDRHRAAVVAERAVAADQIAQSGVTYSVDGRRILVAERSGTVFAVDAVTLEPVGPRLDVGGPVEQIVAGPDGDGGETIVVMREAGTFATIDLAAGRVLGEGDLGLRPGFADVSPDGRSLAVVAADGRVGVIDLGSREWRQPPVAAHESFGYRVDYSPDGSRFITSSWDGRAIVWDGATGASLATVVAGSSSEPMVAVFLDDGHTAAIGTADGAVRWWDVRLDHWLEFACAVAGRDLTAEEWRTALGDRPHRRTCPPG